MLVIEILALMICGYWIGSFISGIIERYMAVFDKKMEVKYRNEEKKLEQKDTRVIGFTGSKK